MQSQAEFRHSYRLYCIRYFVRIAIIFALGALVFSIIWLILEVADQRDDPRTRSEAAMAVAIVVSLVAVVVSARRAEQDVRQDPRLICPQCDCPLGYLYGIIVLSSGNCPHCGQQVLED